MAEAFFCTKCRADVMRGLHCRVHKHFSMGIAIVSLRDVRVRAAILQEGRMATIAGVSVEMRAHKDRVTKLEVLTDIFVAWGHKVEKATPLPEHEIAKFFDEKHIQFGERGKLDNDSSSGEEEDDVASTSTACCTSSFSDEKVSDKEDFDFDSQSEYACGRQSEHDHCDAHMTGASGFPSRKPCLPRAELQRLVSAGSQFLPVKHTFIHYGKGSFQGEDVSFLDCDESFSQKTLSRSASAPGLMMEDPVFALMSAEHEMLEVPKMPEQMAEGSCRTCMYLHQKKDSVSIGPMTNI